MDINVFSVCPKCKGNGVINTQKGFEDPCQMCNGQGKLHVGYIDISDIVDKLDDVIDKLYDIKEKLNES